jgi:Zn finger protein HypA/HybF involved in hydrogenase expression
MGTMIKLICPSCGLNSGTIYEGYGFAKKRYGVIWCKNCRKFSSAVIAVDKYQSGKWKTQKYAIFRCKDCDERVSLFDLNTKSCPICNAIMDQELVGFWD